LGKHAHQYAAFLTYVALHNDAYSRGELRAAFERLPEEGVNHSARVLVQALEAAGEQREAYWTNRVRPFWTGIWPKSPVSEDIAEHLARLAIAARGKFPEALKTIVVWLQPVRHPDLIVHKLHESDLSADAPEDALRLLDAVINDQPLAPKELTECLVAIRQARPALAEDPSYRRLVEYSRRHAG
jgi:hypothetical protein